MVSWKTYFWIVIGILFLILAFYFLQSQKQELEKSPTTTTLITETTTTTPTTKTAPTEATLCPSDYCLQWIYGSCIGNKQRYVERLCYDYPEEATNSSECEAKKRIYYEKSSVVDESC
jgi:hypothetical protein